MIDARWANSTLHTRSSGECLPAFRRDITVCREGPDHVILADPLTGSYFRCGRLENIVRQLLERPESLAQLALRLAEVHPEPVSPAELQAIVDRFQRSGVLEPRVADLRAPAELRTLISRLPGWLKRRGVADLVPLRLPGTEGEWQGLWRRCRSAETTGIPAVAALARQVVAPESLGHEGVLDELELAIRIAWLQHEFRRTRSWCRWWLSWLCFRVPLQKHGLPWLHSLRGWGHPVAVLTLVVVWCLAIGTFLAGGPKLQPVVVLHQVRWVDLLVTLPVVVLLHELAHGIACVRLGGTVREFGILVLIGNVLPYVDVSDTWTLPRSQRLIVTLAGSFSDVSVAAFCYLGLACGATGYGARLCAAATSIGVLSLAINLNPLLRFDGYFLLCDVLNIVNLRQKAVALLMDGVRRIAGIAPSSVRLSRRESLVVGGYAAVAVTLLAIGLVMLVSHAVAAGVP